MPDTLFIVGSILLPLSFGLVPGLLPRRLPLTARWGLWLALLGIAGWFVYAMRHAPGSLDWLAAGLFSLSSLLSLYVLVAETSRAGAARRQAKPASG